MATIKIEKINYFGEETGSNDWNAKVLYYANGKLVHAQIYICFFRKEFHVSKKVQAKECKVYAGLVPALQKMNYFHI
jgi:hypothetical protein